MNNPLVSVVMPVYNVEKYLRKSIDSVLTQTYKHFELIIVNDGSPDESGTIADSYAKKDNRIKVIHKENGGLSDARNIGMENASGKYVYFIDSDDYIEEKLLETCVNLAEINDAEVVIFGFHVDLLDADENMVDTQIIKHHFSIYDKSELKNIELNQNILSMICYAWNKLYNLEYLKRNNYRFTKGLSLVEDIVFNSPVLSRVNRLVVCDLPLYHYISRQRETLVKKFYNNSYELHVMKMNSMLKLLNSWGKTKKDYGEIMSETHITGLRFCWSNMFYIKNSLKFTEKYRYMKMTLNDDLTKSIIQTTSGKNNYIIQFAVKNNLSLGLCILYFCNTVKRRLMD